jgi:adenine phosphoribosyltransferase
MTRTTTKPRRTAAPAGRKGRSGASAAQAALDASLLEAEVMDRDGYPYLVHPLLDGVPRCPPGLLRTWVEWAAAHDLCRKATLLVAPEAMGLPLVSPLALELDIPYAIIRKRKYDLPGEEVAYCETGYGEACLHLNDCWPDDKVLVVDDVISTGATLDGILGTLKGMGVPAVGALVAVDKGTKRASVSERHGVPIVALRTIRIEDGKVHIVARA